MKITAAMYYMMLLHEAKRNQFLSTSVKSEVITTRCFLLSFSEKTINKLRLRVLLLSALD